MTERASLVRTALEAGAAYSAVINMIDIPFEESLRQLCEMNTCGKYNACHTCPPAVGDVKILIQKLKRYRFGLIVQSVYQLEDSFDYEGMMQAAVIHRKTFDEALSRVKAEFPERVILPLNAGSCNICENCTYPDGQPCRYPDRALPSIESYGINVNPMLENAGLHYNNGKNTVSYVGMIFFKE
jgi:predicted metal-binding protein